MVLIPSDVGLRMRLQNEAQLLQPVVPVADIPTDLPELRPGQTFTARIQEALPENTYKALVAGKSLTLSLPEGAKAGDTLDLIVIDRSAKVVLAQVAPKGTGSPADSAYQFTTLSKAGQLIGSLLPHDGETPPPAMLNRGQPLLNSPPLLGAQLAGPLADAIRQSGVFYESHQAQWLSGRLPLNQLLQEPQGGFSNPATLLAAGVHVRGLAAETTQENSALARRRPEAASLLQALFGSEDSSPSAPAEASNRGGTASASQASLQAIPEELRPLVQQQLDALATSRIAWHGEVWPQQTLEWEVEWQQAGGDETAADESAWVTSLRLTSPRLGEVSARLQLTANGVRIAILTPNGDSASDLRDAAPQLDSALSAAGVPLLGFLVHHDDNASGQRSE